MIGKIITGKSFRGCLLYCLNDKRTEQKLEVGHKDRAEILLFNQCYGSQQELIRQFNEVRKLNTKLSKPVLHITLSLAPGEQLTKDKLMEMCQDCARDMGFENNQYVAIVHNDTNHHHVHIVANRIGFDKRTVSDSQNYQKIAKYCRSMELKYGLKQILSPKRFLSKEQQLLPRQDIRKQQLKSDIQQTLRQVKNYGEFELKMESLGYQVLKGRGISFIDGKKVKIKGSEVGFSLMKLEKIFAVKQQLKTTQSGEKVKQAAELNQEHSGSNKSIKDPQKGSTDRLHNAQDQSPVIDLEKQLSDLIYGVMKVEHTPDHLAPEWLKKKRQKKQLRRYL